MHISRRLLCFCVFWACLGMVRASNYYFHTASVKDGLADNFVRDVVRDSQGYVWFATMNGISRYDGYRFMNFLPQEAGGKVNDVTTIRETADGTLWAVCAEELFTYDRAHRSWHKDGAQRLAKLGIRGAMRVMYVDDRRCLWVATDHGLYSYDYGQRQLAHWAHHGSPIVHLVAKRGMAVAVTADYSLYEAAPREQRLVALSKMKVATYNRDSRLMMDNDMNVWTYNAQSLAGTQWVFSLKTRQWRQATELQLLGNVLVNVITKDDDGQLWVGTADAGVMKLKVKSEKVKSEKWGMEVEKLQISHFHSSHITCMYLDENNTIWIGSSKLGVAFTDINSPNFNVVKTGDYEDVSSLIEDSEGNLWIGFDGKGAMKVKSEKVKSEKLDEEGTATFSALRGELPSNVVTSLTLLKDGTLLAGTYGYGIGRWDGRRFAPMFADKECLKYVKAMTTDARGDLWVATVDNGVVRLKSEKVKKLTGEEGTSEQIKVKSEKLNSDEGMVVYTPDNSALLSSGILCLAYDDMRDIVYIGTSMGVSAYDGIKGQFIENEALNKTKDSYVTSLLMSDHCRLWIGSRNGLWIYKPQEGTISHLTTTEGMSHNTVRALAKSGNYVWASTDNGLTCIGIRADDDGKQVYGCLPFLDSDGLSQVVFSNNAALTTTDGRALLGSFSGYVSISPENYLTHYPKLQVQYSEFRINGETMAESPASLTIKHNDRLGIAVSAMVPTLSHKVKYLYRFKGDKEWSRAPGNMLYFASLNSGKHVLQVKAELPGVIESEVAELAIKVQPPVMLSNLAIAIYVLLLAALFYFLNKAIRKRQKRELAMKQMEVNLKKYEMEEEKIRFFTNISHDLKTPLTLVVAPLEKIREKTLPAPIRTEVDVAWRNAKQLNELVLQLLDFRSLDVGKEELNLKHGDLVNFVRQTVQGFTYYAIHKDIRMQMNLPPTPIETDFDENKMRRIITNLLSNAYKYNTKNGTVEVTLEVKNEKLRMEDEGREENDIVLSVADTGIGVKDKRHIFDRFVQESHGQEQEGSGLGLHIVKQYVHMMGGTIEVADNKPKGTIFMVTLPITLKLKSEIVKSDLIKDERIGTKDEEQDGNGKTTILIVDDNMDARLFLQRSLNDEYDVLVAANGKEALEQLANNDRVSIVVSDVMMPVMDGLALFRHIKGNIDYSHIPVILLTAKSSEENIVEGLEEGADDYITKPFSIAVLRLRIKKILEWTQKAHTQVATGLEIKPSEITVSSLDEELISHVISNIEENIQDTSYSVVQLSSAVGMTRGHLYKKLMAITGKSPLEFIRIIKIKRGKSLLDQGKSNISEVADMVGFSAKQFAHYFKMMYHDTPSEYLKKRRNND